jgi:hypothetical protein
MPFGVEILIGSSFLLTFNRVRGSNLRCERLGSKHEILPRNWSASNGSGIVGKTPIAA